MDNSKTKKWALTIVDAGDGTGDGIVELPDDLLAASGWHESDTLALEVLSEGRVLLYRTLAADRLAPLAEDDSAAVRQMRQFIQEAEPAASLEVKVLKNEGLY